MKINRLRLRAQQRAIKAATRADDKAVQSAVGDLADAVAGLQAEVVAKTIGQPAPAVAMPQQTRAVQSAMHDLRENVAELQAEIVAPPGMVKIDLHQAAVTPQEAREIAAKLISAADAAEKP